MNKRSLRSNIPDSKRARSATSSSLPSPAASLSSSPGPILRLYRHALESIFGFLSLNDLITVNTVTRSWHDAVGSMKIIRARLPSLNIRMLPTKIRKGLRFTDVVGRFLNAIISRTSITMGVARHIIDLGQHNYLDHSFLPLLALPNLESLAIDLTTYSNSIAFEQSRFLIFPSKLRELSLLIELPSSGINAALTVAASLPHLTSLYLETKAAHDSITEIDFSRLQPSSITHLSLMFDPHSLTDEQVLQLATLPHLQAMPSIGYDPKLFARLLAYADFKPQWRTLDTGIYALRRDLLSLLRKGCLTQLTELHFHIDSKTDPIDSLSFLLPLQNLTKLTVRSHLLQGAGIPKDAASIIRNLSALTSLDLACSSSTLSDLEQLIPSLPLLTALQLDWCNDLSSFSFLQSSHLLRKLSLFDCRDLNSLRSILPSLSSLTSLNLWTSEVDYQIDSEIDQLALTWQSICPPSVILPQLRSFQLTVQSGHESQGGRRVIHIRE